MTMLYALLPEFLVIAALLLIERARKAPPTDWRMNLKIWAVQLAVAVGILPVIQVGLGAQHS
jgi:hypothetical protein